MDTDGRQIQMFIETQNINGDFVYHPAAEKLTESQTVKLGEADKEWINDIAAAGNIGASTVARNAIEFYRVFYKIHRKLLRYKNAVLNLLNSLP